MPAGLLRAPGAVLLTAAVYYAAAWFGLSFASIAPQVTIVWPPTGIALAAVLLVGERVWPGIALGAFLANLSADTPPGTAAGIAAGNTAEALVAAWLLRRAGFRPAFDRMRDVLSLIAFGALASTAVSATGGVFSLCAGGVQPWSHFRSLWSVWWIGDAIGDLVMAPLLLAWWAHGHVLRRRLAESVLVFGSTALVSLAVFAGDPALGARGYPLQYAVFPLVAWAAMRLGQAGTTGVTALVSAVAIWSTAHQLGPFATPAVHESLVLLQLFMGVVACTGLLLAAAIAERDTVAAGRASDYAALERGEERLRLALEAGRMGVWEWNIATGAVEWTPSLEPLHGLPPGSFDGTFAMFRSLLHPEERARVEAAIADAVGTGHGYDIEFRIVWPDGSLHWVATQGTVLKDAAGRPVRMLGITADVTERRRLEEELRQRAEELIAADRRKDEFLAMLAHELRNPLAPLSTSLHLLARDIPGRERFLEMADRQVKHLVRLIDDLLDVSRITRGKIRLRREPVVLADVIARAVELTRPLVSARGHTLAISLPSEPVRLEADAVRLAQVFANLLGNAATYTPTGGSIWVSAERHDGEVAVRVRDTGVGLSADLLPRIFDLFVQGDTSLDRTRGGLGIGLTLARALVELHDGRIEAHSAGVGQGSDFVVTLRTAPDVGEPRSGDVPPPAPPAPRHLRILIVEDYHDAAESLAVMLELAGHEVRIALDGLAALKALETFAPDVVISDLGLPGMDGFELARQIRRAPGHDRAVMIALSGYGRDEDRRLALEAGFDHHLVKPPEPGALLGLLERVAGERTLEPPRTLH